MYITYEILKAELTYMSYRVVVVNSILEKFYSKKKIRMYNQKNEKKKENIQKQKKLSSVVSNEKKKKLKNHFSFE